MVDLSLRKIFQDNLSRLLSEKNVTQKDLAQYMVVSAPTVNDWVKGRKIPRMDKIDKLCIFFGVNRSDLIEQKTASVQSTLMQPSKHGVRIPVLGKVVAGIPLDAIEDILDYEEITPTLREGDIVIVRKQRPMHSAPSCGAQNKKIPPCQMTERDMYKYESAS